MTEIFSVLKIAPDYLVTNMGRVISLKRKPLRELVKIRDKSGYLRVSLYNGKHFTKNIHQLVASEFLDYPNGDLVVNHINGIKTDNRVSNLEVVSRSRNTQHAYDTKLINTKNKRGELHANSILKECDVVFIKEIHSSGTMTVSELAKLYNFVSRSCVEDIVYKRNWGWL